MTNMNFLCKLTTVIPCLLCKFRTVNTVTSIAKLVSIVTSDLVNSCNFAIGAFASKCFPIQLVWYCDGWRRTWWQTIYMILRLQVSSILQCKLSSCQSKCLELFHAIERFESTCMEPHQAWTMICKVSLLTSAKCNSVQKPYPTLQDTPVALTSASKYFQLLPAPPGALQSALRLCKSIVKCCWKHLHWWRCIQDATKFDY